MSRLVSKKEEERANNQKEKWTEEGIDLLKN